MSVAGKLLDDSSTLVDVSRSEYFAPGRAEAAKLGKDLQGEKVFAGMLRDNSRI